MIVFNADMDNTIIYSYKHHIGERKHCAERYQGREIAFMTDRTAELLKELSRKILIVPTTTRTREQYERIDLGLGQMPYALVCNGGVLLVNGEEDKSWYDASREMIQDCQKELEKGERLLEEEENRCLEVRNIRKLFLFSKSSQPEATIQRLSERLDTSLVDVFSHGIKVYAVPKKLSKGNAIKRFREVVKADQVIAAGDSIFDISMLQYADIAMAPYGLEIGEKPSGELVRIKETTLFSEGLLEYLNRRFPEAE